MPPPHRPPHGPPGQASRREHASEHAAAHPHPHPNSLPRHGPGHRHALPASQVLDFVDEAQLQQALAPMLADTGDRRFVTRCLVGEGPLHHRGANYILLTLLARAVQARGGLPSGNGGAPVPMRLPPHLADKAEDGHYPLRLPLRALGELAAGDAARLAAMVDCLTDGPPQHALANVAMMALIEALLPASPGAAQ